MSSDPSNLDSTPVESTPAKLEKTDVSSAEAVPNDERRDVAAADVTPTGPTDIPPEKEPPSGGFMLPGSAFSGHLDTFFQPGTADESQIRAVGYDLRIGTRFMIVPDGRALHRSPKLYPPGCPESCSRFTLEPGEAAFISTTEQFQLDRYTGGILAVKPGTARAGLLVSTGSWVDPGFGSLHGEPEPLFFQIGNIGDKAIELNAGRDSLVTFLPFRFLREQRSGRVLTTQKDVAKEFFKDQMDKIPSLALLHEFASLQNELDQTNRDIQREISSRNVVAFGVYLVSITLFGICLTVFLSWGSDGSIVTRIHNISHALPTNGGQLALLGLLVVASGAAFISALHFVTGLIDRSISGLGRHSRRMTSHRR